MTPTEAINHLESVAACEPEDFEAVAVIRAAIGFDPGSAKWCTQQPGYLPPSEVGRLREAVEFAAREFRRLGRENSARQMDGALSAERTEK